MIKRIAIFDFDGTLISTPLPETGKVRYEQVTGKKWPHKGWWGRPESLNMNIFEMPAIDHVVEAYFREKEKADTLLVMMTGRMKQLQNEVKLILDSKGLTFDKYIYNTGGPTMEYKLRKLGYFKNDHSEIETMILFEDRDEHVIHFKLFGDQLIKNGDLIEFEVIHVKT